VQPFNLFNNLMGKRCKVTWNWILYWP